MSGLSAWVDGELGPVGSASVGVLDRGFRAGEGVFETVRAYGDHLFRLEEHAERARAGARELGFDLGSELLTLAMRSTAAANHGPLEGADSVVRLTATAGALDPDSVFPGTGGGEATIVVTSHRLATDPQQPGTGATAVTTDLVRPLPQVKSLSYAAALVALRRARAAGADEALLTAADGSVLEGATSNVFAVIDGTLVTPPADAGLLAGVTRGVVLAVAGGLGLRVELRVLHRDELRGAAEAFLTSSVREVMPLLAVDGEPLGRRVAGPVTVAVQQAYRAEVRAERRAAGAA